MYEFLKFKLNIAEKKLVSLETGISKILRIMS